MVITSDLCAGSSQDRRELWRDRIGTLPNSAAGREETAALAAEIGRGLNGSVSSVKLCQRSG